MTPPTVFSMRDWFTLAIVAYALQIVLVEVLR